MPAAAAPQSTDLLTRAATFAPSSFNRDQRTVEIVWSTGAPVLRYDFEGPYTERLSLDPEAVDLSGLRGAPLLDTHDRWTVRSILGVVENPAVDGSRGTAKVRFSDRADVAGVLADVASGIISKASVGYKVQNWATTKDAQGGRVKTATRWSPLEISFTALAADAGAGTRSLNMPEALTVPEQIRSAASLLGITGEVVDTLSARADITIEAARGELLRHLREQQPRIDGRSPAMNTRDEHDDFLARAANAVAHRVRPSIKLRDDARPWYGRRFADIGRECLRMEGVSTLGSDAEIIRRWGSLHTTSDFSSFLSELFNKQLLQDFVIAASGLRLLARRATVNDFRAKHVYRDSPIGQLQPVNQHGEFKRVTKADVRPESYSVGTFAAVFGISRQALVNDDMNIFGDIASDLSIQAREFENQQLAALLVSNPIMSDGNALFSAAHGNLAAPGSAIAGPGLSAARLALRLSVNQNGQPIAVAPKYLLTSATNETAAEQALAAIYPPTTADSNVFEAAFELVTDARLDHLSQTLGWYIFGDPSLCPVLEYSYLSGAEGPTVETRSQFSQGADIDGTEVLVKLDYGCGCISSVGAFKNPGA